MVRDIRIKELRIPENGSLVSNANGIISVFGQHPINGEIQKIRMVYNDTTSTGSLLFFCSGINENFYIQRTFDSTSMKYPRVPLVGPSGNAITGVGQAQVNDVIQVIGSGLGDTKTIDEIRIYYR